MTKDKSQSSSPTETVLKHRTVEDIWSIEIVENRRHDIWSRAARIKRLGEAWGEVRKKHNGLLVTMIPYGKVIPVTVLKAAEKDLR